MKFAKSVASEVPGSGAGGAPAQGAPANLSVAAIAVLVTIQTVWGFNWIVAKSAFEEVPPLLFTAIRFAALALVLAPFMRWHRGRMARVGLIALGAGAGHFGFMFYGLSLAEDVGPPAIAIQLSIPLATLMSVIFLKERVGLWRSLAILLAFGGIFVMAFDPRVASYIDSVFVVSLAALSWAIAAIFMRQMRDIGVYDMQGWIALGTWPCLFAASLALEGDPVAPISQASLEAFAAIAYSAVAGTLIGHAGLFWLLQRYPIAQMAPLLSLAPIIAALAGVWLLDNILTWRMVAGGLLTMTGVLIITMREAARRAPKLGDKDLG